MVGMTIAHVVRQPIYSFGTQKTTVGSLLKNYGCVNKYV
jgi:hypothetical protein